MTLGLVFLGLETRLGWGEGQTALSLAGRLSLPAGTALGLSLTSALQKACVRLLLRSLQNLPVLEEEVQLWPALCSGRGLLAPLAALLGKVLAGWFQASTTCCVQCIPRKCMHPSCAHSGAMRFCLLCRSCQVPPALRFLL